MHLDRTLHMLRQGYPWTARVRGGAVAAPTRLAGRRAVIVGGPDGVRRFYDPRLQRRGAFPPPVKLVLFGPGTVHGLDDDEHHIRKAMIIDVLTPTSVASLVLRAQDEWDAAVRRRPGRMVLFDEAVRVQGPVVLRWAGVPDEADHDRRARQMAAVVDGFAKPGLAYARAVAARLQLGAWSQGLVRRTRARDLQPPEGTALHAAATARDRHGRLLPERVAATELLNVVRPTVAVAWFIAFAGAAAG